MTSTAVNADYDFANALRHQFSDSPRNAPVSGDSTESMRSSSAAGCSNEGLRHPRIELTEDDAAAGLGKLALAIVNLLHELLERQAIRRMELNTITDEEVDRVGRALQKQSEAIDQLCETFGVTRDELNLDLGPLGRMI